MSSRENEPSVARAQGLRQYQEDRYLKHRIDAAGHKGLLMAIVDGHGGSSTAEMVAQSAVRLFTQALSEYKDNLEGALSKTVAELDRITREQKSGTTLSLVFVPDGESHAHVAVIGDSPVIIKDRKGKINISPDHNVRSNPEELQAAIGRGAHYEQGYIFNPHSGDGLQMSRALGDRNLEGILSREPDVYSVELGVGSIIIIASDGVFDPGHADTLQEIHQALELVGGGGDARALVDDAIMRMTGDNASAIVWRASST